MPYGKVIIRNMWMLTFYVVVSNVIGKILDFGATGYTKCTLVSKVLHFDFDDRDGVCKCVLNLWLGFISYKIR